MRNTQILEEAADWFVSMRDGDADSTAREQFATWLCKSPEHQRAYLEVTSLWADLPDVAPDRSGSADALIAAAHAEDNVVAWQPTSRTPIPVTERRNPTLAAASLAALACIAGATLWYQTQRAPTYTTDIGEQRSLTLPDGSSLELNARSKVRVRFSDTERLVDLLDGQAYFRVAKDPARPFIVRSDIMRVRAVGTQFDVYRKTGGTTVTVLEGKVEVALDRASGSVPDIQTLSSTPLIAGQQVIVQANRIETPRPANMAAATAWTQKQLVFEAASIADIAREFNRHNRRQLVIEGADFEGLQFSGVFSSTDPAPLLDFLRSQQEFAVTETPEEIRIARVTGAK